MAFEWNRRVMKVLDHRSENGRSVRVVEYKFDGSRLYFEGPSLYTHVDANGTNQLGYITAMGQAMAGRPSVLLLGTAGGALATQLSRAGASVTAVDDCSAAFELARQWFHLPPDVECLHAEALAFLKSAERRWSAVAVDVFHGVEIPDAFFTSDIGALLLGVLEPDGLIVWNVADSSLSWTVHRLMKTLRVAGLQPSAIPVLSGDVGNTLIICAARRPSGAADALSD